jgi:hypothetical protein
MRSIRLLAVAVLAIVLALSSAQNAFATTELAYDTNSWFDNQSLDVGESIAVRFTLSDFVSWPQARVVRVAFYVYSGNAAFRVHIRGNLGTECTGLDLATFDVTPHVLQDWNYYDVSGSVVVSGEFCVVAEWLTLGIPYIGLSNPPFGSGHSYRYQGGLWFHDTGYDDMIRAYVDLVAPSAPVGGVVMPANTLAILTPWLAVIGLVGCIGTVVAVARSWKKREN